MLKKGEVYLKESINDLSIHYGNITSSILLEMFVSWILRRVYFALWLVQKTGTTLSTNQMQN